MFSKTTARQIREPKEGAESIARRRTREAYGVRRFPSHSIRFARFETLKSNMRPGAFLNCISFRTKWFRRSSPDRHNREAILFCLAFDISRAALDSSFLRPRLLQREKHRCPPHNRLPRRLQLWGNT